jgi:hypothetical protein
MTAVPELRVELRVENVLAKKESCFVTSVCWFLLPHNLRKATTERVGVSSRFNSIQIHAFTCMM